MTERDGVVAAVPVQGHETRAERFAQGIVESLTEWDFVDLPADLADDLVAWSERFGRWMDDH